MSVQSSRPDLSVHAHDGSVDVREVVAAVFYSRSTNESLRDMAAATIRKIVRLLGHRFFSLYVDFEGEQQPLDESMLEVLIDQRFSGPLRAPNANLILTSDELDVPAFYLWYNGKSVHDPADHEASYLWFWLPRAHFAENADTVMAMLDDIAVTFPLSSAYASLAFAGQHNLQKQALARRYLAYDIADPLCVSADIGEDAAGAYWLNYLSADLVERLEGLANLRLQLTGATSIRELRHGVCRVQFGEEPASGDINRQEDVAAYRSFAALLATHSALHIPQKVVYFFDHQGIADRDAMTAWHRRFLG